MGSLTQHRKKADHIQHFADAIRESDHPEWVVTALFYKALHLIEMMLASKSVHTTTHEQRRVYLKENHPEILRYYKPIYNYSVVCRYRFMPIGNNDIVTVEGNLSELARLIELEIEEG